jgi:integral membrane protein
MNPRTAVQLFRTVAVAEALTWVGLLTGMYVKYVPETTELGVKVFGPIHGAVFVLYVAVTLLTTRRLGWSVPTALLALAASVPPFATVVFEWWARRSGRLGAVETA